MPKTLIIGYGNSLRRDDGLGIAAAERLMEIFAEQDGIEVVAATQLTPELADKIKNFTEVVFIDCSVEGEPGEIAMNEISARPDIIPRLEHSISPAYIINLTKKLYNTNPHAIVFSLTGKEFGLGESLSEKVSNQLGNLIEGIRKYIEGLYQ
ncbi:MAG: hydrogenase maturation protease [candidate division Zixibacteria bacterium]|nr:hydrogenase maturation protease [candidate division Zixibacteria bacterium]